MYFLPVYIQGADRKEMFDRIKVEVKPSFYYTTEYPLFLI